MLAVSSTTDSMRIKLLTKKLENVKPSQLHSVPHNEKLIWLLKVSH